MKWYIQDAFMGDRSITWLGCPGGALKDEDDVAGVGNTEREEVVEEDDADEDEETETELVTVERTEDPVAEAEEVIDTDELPVAEVGVGEVLRDINVSHEEHINLGR